MLNENLEKDFYTLPKQLRISTMTATSKFNSQINLTNIYEYLNADENINYIEFGDQNKGISCKQKGCNKKKKFFNQITIEIKSGNNLHNLKLFNNGSISMTGIKSKINGIKTVNLLYKKLISIKDKNIYDVENLELLYFKIVLINSDYHIGYEIVRNELHQLLVNDYKIFSSFEPCIYPGVNSKFFWNKDYKDKPFKGKCYCNTFCNGKGNGNGEGDCKKVTISAFQSGSIIITGAQSIEQIVDSFNFINQIFQTYYKQLKKEVPLFINYNAKPKNLIYIDKNKIIN